VKYSAAGLTAGLRWKPSTPVDFFWPIRFNGPNRRASCQRS
jgi:hypothetical protein